MLPEEPVDGSVLRPRVTGIATARLRTPPPVWLLPLFSPIARLAAAVFYRARYAGDRVPATGPALLVANHPNSLLDPTLVVAAAQRPVRFLAKAPLFSDRKIGWLVKAAGAIPVYRRADDPAQMNRNEDAFRAVWEALGSGSAVGIFPEGTSHSEPSMAPLRTGAADRVRCRGARRRRLPDRAGRPRLPAEGHLPVGRHGPAW